MVAINQARAMRQHPHACRITYPADARGNPPGTPHDWKVEWPEYDSNSMGSSD
jgi:hypothetical protein